MPIKGRSWAFILYPDSMPSNYQEIITELGLPFAISPLHDKDINPDGEPKKPHYHVIVYYDNPTTYKNVNDNVCKPLNATIPKKLESMRGMFRYHLHLDNPEKYQYDDRDRQFFNGFDINQVNSLTATEEFKILKQLFSFIRDNNILEYSDLINILQDNDSTELLQVASRKTIVLNTYLCSLRNKLKRENN